MYTEGDKMGRHQVVSTETGNWSDFLACIDNGLSALQGADRVNTPVDWLGVSIPGTVDPVSGHTHCANVPSISGIPLEQALSEHTGITVKVRNDAECLALAEAHSGAGRGYVNMFAIILGSGIGGAIIVDSTLVTGATGQSGEWGHGNDVSAAVEKYGLQHRECGCGRQNCVDLFGAGLGMANIHRDLCGADLSARQILEALHNDDADAARTVAVFVDIVSSQLALAVNVIDPDIVPVAGGLSQDATLIAELDSATRARSLGRLERPLVVPAVHNEHGCLLGASLLHKTGEG